MKRFPELSFHYLLHVFDENSSQKAYTCIPLTLTFLNCYGPFCKRSRNLALFTFDFCNYENSDNDR